MKDGRRFGRPPEPYQPPETPTGKINVTDPDSQLVKATRGWIQGCNAQAVTNEQQIVVAAEVTVDSPDFGHLEPKTQLGEHHPVGLRPRRRVGRKWKVAEETAR